MEAGPACRYRPFPLTKRRQRVNGSRCETGNCGQSCGHLRKCGAMRVIFLDIDGVLNSRESVLSGECPIVCGIIDVSPTLLSRFNALVSDTGASVVISSTWRLFPSNRERLSDLGIKFIGCTRESHGKSPLGLYIGSERKHEIRDWLKDNQDQEIEDYVILDDSMDADISGHFYRTNGETGLTQSICDSIRKRWMGGTAV
jgi:hypothetical protein